MIDISATQGHIVPACQVFHDGNFYVSNLGTYPLSDLSSVFQITPGGHISVVATGFSAVLGITFDEVGGMYLLENTTGNPFPTAGTGDIIRIDPSGEKLTIASGLNYPTAMTFGPDNKLYVSIWALTVFQDRERSGNLMSLAQNTIILLKNRIGIYVTIN